jgi:hypothetical protein
VRAKKANRPAGRCAAAQAGFAQKEPADKNAKSKRRKRKAAIGVAFLPRSRADSD